MASKGLRLVLIFVFSLATALALFFYGIHRDSGTLGINGAHDSERFSFSHYSGGNIGVVFIDGIIEDSLDVLSTLNEYQENPRIEAILVRLDSPGGAVGPSQEIYDELLKIRREDKKKVIVSMGSIAASGALYIACGAHLVVAEKGTLTGSIGVIMQLANLEELFKFLKVAPFTIKGGKYKDAGSPNRKMTPQELKLFQDMIDETHLQFQRAVAEGRGLSLDYVKTYADGRIMTGEKAKSYGLVDRLGNWRDAIDLAAETAKIKDPKLVYPEEYRWRALREVFGSIARGAQHVLRNMGIVPAGRAQVAPAYLWDGK